MKDAGQTGKDGANGDWWSEWVTSWRHRPTSDGTLRQAVVVIHGIGEQKPMTTLRSFAAGVIPGSSDPEHPAFESHPDRITRSLDLFTLRAPPKLANVDDPITDFYECYWAQQMRDTQLRQVTRWFLQLARHFPRGNKRLAGVYLTAYLIVGLSLWAVLALVPLPALVSYGTAPVIALLSGALVQHYVLGYVGDAARYLTPHPDNIAERAAIRQRALDLLNQLHRCNRYQRIVVVGHSLGSVIAYDVVTHLWDSYRDLQTVRGDPQSALMAAEIASKALRDAGSNPDDETRLAFHDAQRALWRELRKNGNPWLITDLITLGSPLAHAGHLMRVAGVELKTLQEAREYPECPPRKDNWERRSDQVPEFENQGSRGDRSLAYFSSSLGKHLLVPSAVFAFVRWSNLYFPGDVIGGPLASVFGQGITDFRVRRAANCGVRQWLRNWWISSHTAYWTPCDTDGGVSRDAKPPEPLAALRQTLALDTDKTRALLRTRVPEQPQTKGSRFAAMHRPVQTVWPSMRKTRLSRRGGSSRSGQ